MNKTVAIVGAHQDTRHLAPWDDPSIDIWVFNECAMMDWCKRADAVFQPHLPTVYKNPKNRADEGYWSWLQNTHAFPIYMIDADPDVPASVAYPALEELYAAFPTVERRMFTGVATYALAYAAYIGVDKVLLYGVEADFYSEYKQQREALAYWVGFLQGRGIVVERHCADGIFVNPIYGRENIWYQDPARYVGRIAELKHQVEVARKAIPVYTSNGWQDAFVALCVAEGRLAEANRYYEKVQAMIKATGEAILDRTELERAAKDLLPQIDAQRMTAQQYRGIDFGKFKAHYGEASQLAGRWQENIDMMKGAPLATSYYQPEAV